MCKESFFLASPSALLHLSRFSPLSSAPPRNPNENTSWAFPRVLPPEHRDRHLFLLDAFGLALVRGGRHQEATVGHHRQVAPEHVVALQPNELHLQFNLSNKVTQNEGWALNGLGLPGQGQGARATLVGP